MGFDPTAQDHVVDIALEPGMGIEDPVHVEGGIPPFGLDDDGVGGVASPPNEVVVFREGDTDACIHAVVDERWDTLPRDECATGKDPLLRNVGPGLERRRMEPPMHQVGTRRVAPAVAAAWEIGILEDVEQVVATAPEQRPVRIEGRTGTLRCHEMVPRYVALFAFGHASLPGGYCRS